MEEKCVICGKEIHGYGNNPYPVREEGSCCDDCNWNTVVPARLSYLNLTSDLIGKKIMILNMHGEPAYKNKIGTVESIDDFGQIHGTWGGIALIPNVDQFAVLKEVK